MGIRTFIFCDRCNPEGNHNIYVDDSHDKRNSGKRSTDKCNVYEGRLDDAIQLGWQLSEQGDILCPHCVENGMGMLLIDDRWDSKEIKRNINIYKHSHENK